VKEALIFVNAGKEEKKYEKGSKGLLIVDHHWSHLCDSFKELLILMDVDVAMIFKGAKELFSVLDVSINKPFKAHLRNSYSEWALRKGIQPENVQIDVRT
jgi:hypothetical protein